jgi:hypothetical protein
MTSIDWGFPNNSIKEPIPKVGTSKPVSIQNTTLFLFIIFLDKSDFIHATIRLQIYVQLFGFANFKLKKKLVGGSIFMGIKILPTD